MIEDFKRGKNEGNGIFQGIFFGIVGWSSTCTTYVSIRDANLPGFKALPPVQFSTRMWHVAILVTSGPSPTIYWPLNVPSTIYLLSLLSLSLSYFSLISSSFFPLLILIFFLSFLNSSFLFPLFRFDFSLTQVFVTFSSLFLSLPIS